MLTADSVCTITISKRGGSDLSPHFVDDVATDLHMRVQITAPNQSQIISAISETIRARRSCCRTVSCNYFHSPIKPGNLKCFPMIDSIEGENGRMGVSAAVAKIIVNTPQTIIATIILGQRIKNTLKSSSSESRSPSALDSLQSPHRSDLHFTCSSSISKAWTWTKKHMIAWNENSKIPNGKDLFGLICTINYP